MTDTTIKVPTEVRDRLAVLAGERGTTIRDLVVELAQQLPTEEEQFERRRVAADYIQQHLRPDFDDADLEAGERFWQQLERGSRGQVA